LYTNRDIKFGTILGSEGITVLDCFVDVGDMPFNVCPSSDIIRLANRLWTSFCF